MKVGGNIFGTPANGAPRGTAPLPLFGMNVEQAPLAGQLSNSSFGFVGFGLSVRLAFESDCFCWCFLLSWFVNGLFVVA